MEVGEDGVAIITMSNPPVNAVAPTGNDSLTSILLLLLLLLLLLSVLVSVFGRGISSNRFQA
ncbi:hypothetical protein AXF42_Ash005362 [Apostasia shenzhenica]|uniref:Uncharacterized protein n=1 Tax=Apostasia shenzhenica TaxID=1088818 RepID=A0A2I0B6N9_9ASPA|nr:hypothetical protein AXF42_Ash005362 [Apostasia shenzhenica]